jgi:hypothetical protein
MSREPRRRAAGRIQRTPTVPTVRCRARVVTFRDLSATFSTAGLPLSASIERCSGVRIGAAAREERRVRRLSRLVVVVGQELGVDATELARVWNNDSESRAYGSAETETSESGVFLPGPAELIVIPLAVNLASNVIYDVVRRLVNRLRDRRATASEELEVIEHQTGSDRLVVVRVRRTVR